MLLATVGSPHHQTRRGVASLLGAACASALELPPPQAAAFASAIRALVCDTDATVRATAASAFWELHRRSVADADAILPQVQPPQQKLIQRSKPAAK